MRNRSCIVLFFILLFSSFLRLYRLDQIPIAFTHDETALGYTAYSLLKTGADIQGNFLPLAISPFGNWTLPLYSYVTTIPIVILGLSEFATRLPSALSGIISTFLLYKIAEILFKNKKTGIIAAVLFAISPWSIYFSRIAYEVNLATTFFLGGLFAFLHYQSSKNKNELLLLLASLLFGLTLFTYYSYVIFMPLFLIVLIWIHRKKITQSTLAYTSMILFCLLFIVSIFSTLTQSFKQISNISIFDDASVKHNRVDRLRGDKTHANLGANLLLHNKYLGVSYQLAQNYIQTFDVTFLFDSGGEKVLNNIEFFGNFYLFDAVLLITGVVSMFWFHEKNLNLFILWFLLTPLASTITKDAPSSSRLFPILPLFILISAYGVVRISQYLKALGRFSYALGFALTFLFIINILYFMDLYFVHLNYHHSRNLHYGYKQAVEIANKYSNKKVIMRGPENFPFISFLFYNKYDPIQFREEVKYYPVRKEDGFLLVESFGRYKFVNFIERSKLIPNTLYIDDVKKGDKSNFIKLPSGEPLFTYIIQD